MNDIRGLLRGDKRVIARTISDVEDDTAERLLERIFPHTGGAYHIGITGPPGAGKSTLVNAIALQLVARKKKIGIIAVDPSSPFSGGALLGDRVRMNDLALNDRVFIRSMASRGSLGGLARTTKDVALVLDAAGMDYIIIETIGVGQVELDIAQVCDTTVVVLVPESGDSIQAMKAGLLEIADVMVVNKGDREGGERLVTELKFAFEMREQKLGWPYPVLETVATEGEGINDLLSAIESHAGYLMKTGRLERERKAKLMLRVHELVELKIRSHLVENVLRKDDLTKLADSMYKRELSPYRVADRITKKIVKGGR
ncbi:MAG: methylmalonyl Co-A mutase-associated GTPase MeaB [candidate division WOR-3 bacterium]|nr:MAG: methylmalonyl Co-A mutase-associated GTPase MeaB [candidate division WOR-3 bacterium]